MSNYKKAWKMNQKTHRERHQPASRAHLGILEKKKDYKKRSSDHQEKQETLRLLKKRALLRNPDEFDFKMLKSKVKDGIHTELSTDDGHTPDQIKLMKSQDIKYVKLMHTSERKKIDRLQSQLHILDTGISKNKHIFFVDSGKEAKSFDVATHLDTHPDLLERRTNRPRLSELKKLTIPIPSTNTLTNSQNKRDSSYKELQKRIAREKELNVITRKLEVVGAVKKTKRGGVRLITKATAKAPAVYSWKQARKK